MNGKKVKLLRKLIYPGDMSSRAKHYKTITTALSLVGDRFVSGQRIASHAAAGA